MTVLQHSLEESLRTELQYHSEDIHVSSIVRNPSDPTGSILYKCSIDASNYLYPEDFSNFSSRLCREWSERGRRYTRETNIRTLRHSVFRLRPEEFYLNQMLTEAGNSRNVEIRGSTPGCVSRGK